MILIIDSSSRIVAIATVDGGRSEVFMPSRSPELLPTIRRIVETGAISRVAVATGPGSFTGLRVGVSLALGIAIGLRVPIIALPSLELLAARSRQPATAVIDAGRGRFYYRVPGGEPEMGEVADIPTSHPLVGGPGLVVSGRPLQAEDELLSFAEAAETLLESASEVPYRNLKIEYMQFFSAKR